MAITNKRLSQVHFILWDLMSLMDLTFHVGTNSIKSLNTDSWYFSYLSFFCFEYCWKIIYVSRLSPFSNPTLIIWDPRQNNIINSKMEPSIKKSIALIYRYLLLTFIFLTITTNNLNENIFFGPFQLWAIGGRTPPPPLRAGPDPSYVPF